MQNPTRIVLAALAVLAATPSVHAETAQQELARLRAENATLKGEVKKLKKEPVKNEWVRQLSAGLVLTSGNNDTLNIVAGVSADKETDHDKFHSFLTGAYGENNHKKNSQFLRGGVQYNRDLTAQLYWYGALGFEHDDVSNLDLRVGVGPGLGVHLVKTDAIELNLEAGVAYYYEKYKVGGTGDENSIRMRGAQTFAYKFAPGAKFFESFDIASDLGDTGNYIINFEAGVESALSETLKLRLSFLDRYAAQPPLGNDKNDIQLVSSLVIGF
jgi:putative salt-induced outer membrane protein YdiY